MEFEVRPTAEERFRETENLEHRTSPVSRTKKEITDLLLVHEVWLRTDGADGARLFVADADFRQAFRSLIIDPRTALTDNEIAFSSYDLREGVAIWSRFDNGDLEGHCFRNAILWESSFKESLLAYADFSGAECENSCFEGASLRNANLRGTSLIGANLKNVNLTGADLEGADLEGANLAGANLSKARLDNAILVGTNLKGATLRGVSLVGAYIADTVDSVRDSMRYRFRARTLPPFPDANETKKVVKIFYGTDRKRSGEAHPDWYYLNKWSSPSSLSTGYCLVQLPRDRAVTRYERFPLRITELSEAPFTSELAEAIKSAEKPEVLVFIHGFRVKFADAVRRFAQVVEDMSFKGVPVLYSWSSGGGAAKYDTDADAVILARSTLPTLIKKIAETNLVKQLHVMSHSMGGRALLELVRNRDRTLARRGLISEIVFSAPDVGSQDFRQSFPLRHPPKRVSLYASSKDLALKLSAKLKDMERAGFAGRELVVIKDVETIDATNVADRPSGHSYFAASRPVLTDCGYLISEGLPADRRVGLKREDQHHPPYWFFAR